MKYRRVDQTVRRTTFPGAVAKFMDGVTDRQVKVVASDGSRDRCGDILVPEGCQLANFRRNPVVLAQHDANQPIGRCPAISADTAAVTALIQFPETGVNERADLYCALLKTGFIGAVSVGFLGIRRQSTADGNGWKYTEWELLELSVVSVPANTNAIVTERSIAGRRVSLSRTERMSRDADLAVAAIHAARLARDQERRMRELGKRALVLWEKGLL
jgi:HK97 family phage prohead protease